MVRNLHQLPELRESRFGRPPPRHGLNLLWWFVHQCVWIDSNEQITALCNPANGPFGFHRFFNREGLLPRTHLKYYEVGNLHSTDSLPHYVTEYYTGQLDDSNSDRVIVCYDLRWNRFDSIYVTRHSDLRNFDQNHTYCITVDLLKLIKGMKHDQFLREILNEPKKHAIYHDNQPSTIINMPRPVPRPTASVQRQSSTRSTNKCRNWCIGLSCAIVLAVIVAVVTFLVLKFK